MIVQSNNKLIAMFDLELNKDAITIADSEALECIEKLKTIKSHLRILEEQEKALSSKIKSLIGDHESLVDDNGSTLATYKVYEGGMKLHVDTLKEIFPHVYNDCLSKAEDYRRLVIK